MYLRYLCLQEVKSGGQIPIFIEFRNLGFERTLREELIAAIRELGIDLDATIFEYLAGSEKVVFILDGFDEIPNNKRMKVARELETIARTYPKLRIVISSRPDSGMGGSAFFQKYIINKIGLERQCEFVDHIYHSSADAGDIKNILTESEFLSEVTTTPLLLILFAITYSPRKFKPDSLAEFYSSIFPAMLYRHDRLKIGFERERKSGLTDYQMQRVFEAFSFVSLKENRTRFSKPKFRQYLDLACNVESIAKDLEDKIIEDITKITALVIPDGFDDFSFSHKSIQEYFSAVFVSRIEDYRKQLFYKAICENLDDFRKWQNVISFLETIDSNAYKKYLLLPHKRTILNIDQNGRVNMDYKSIERLVGADSRMLVDEDGQILEVYWGDTDTAVMQKEYSDFSRQRTLFFLRINKRKIADFIAFCDEGAYGAYQRGDREFIVDINALLRQEGLARSLCVQLSQDFEGSVFVKKLQIEEVVLNQSEGMMDKLFSD